MPAALVLLSSTTLAANGTFDVQNIDQSYSDLVGVCICRGADTGQNDLLKMLINGDTSASYGSQLLWGEAATVSTAVNSATTTVRLNEAMVANGGTAGNYAVVEFTIYGYASTAFHKVIHIRSASPTLSFTQFWTEASMGLWASTAAINEIALTGSATPNLLAGSQFRLYGRS